MWFLLFCSALMIGAAPFMALSFLGRPLAFMMVYVWGRWVRSAPRSYVYLCTCVSTSRRNRGARKSAFRGRAFRSMVGGRRSAILLFGCSAVCKFVAVGLLAFSVRQKKKKKKPGCCLPKCFLQHVFFLEHNRGFAAIYFLCPDDCSLCRRNEHVRMNLLGMFPFTAPYLAWVFLILSAVLGSPLETDLVGAAFGCFCCLVCVSDDRFLCVYVCM